MAATRRDPFHPTHPAPFVLIYPGTLAPRTKEIGIPGMRGMTPCAEKTHGRDEARSLSSNASGPLRSDISGHAGAKNEGDRDSRDERDDSVRGEDSWPRRGAIPFIQRIRPPSF